MMLIRRYLKKQILSILYTLRDANRHIEESIKRGKNEQLYDVLAECQNCAIEIGNQLEHSAENVEGVVKQLEQFCELLYQISIALQNKKNNIAQVYVKDAGTCLHRIINIIETMKTDKLEVLFLPYKMAMWSSLESIYEAFLKDKTCNVQVLPIPYYDVGNGKDKKMLYEGESFKEKMPILYYQDCDIEKMHPDVIFIHNPYDGTNNLTRVDERFYSINLVRHTECLVYSPYFTYGNYIAGYSDHQYVNPATLIADKIIVQSEKTKKIFCDLNIEEKKLMVVGSPKTDAIINNMKKAEMPYPWQKKLEGRKVFLLNTHLSYFGTMYRNREKNGNIGVKMHNEIFDAIVNKEGVAMIWRPHPLMFNMLNDRFPECVPYVESLVKRIEESENCVMDLYSDYIPAFKYSDAMISTWSTLINDYMITGKPVMIFQRQPTEEVRRQSPVDRGINYFRFGKNRISFEQYIHMVKNGEDPIKNQRMQMINEAFLNSNGKVGEIVREKIKDFFENCR